MRDSMPVLSRASHHEPERTSYRAWVSDGDRAMDNSGEAKGGTVKVRAYTRTRDGKTEHVGAHSHAGGNRRFGGQYEIRYRPGRAGQ